MLYVILPDRKYLNNFIDDNPVGEPCNANQFGISSRPLPLRAFNAPSDRRDVAYCLSACLIIMDVM